MKVTGWVLSCSLMIGLAACGDAPLERDAPAPASLTRSATGHYCGMIVIDHDGPKGQIFVRGRDSPLWFSSVRDTLAFTLLPEETRAIRAIYVNDMARAESWAVPGRGNWIEARSAIYVIGSSRHGGMGAQEAVPFSSRTVAQHFSKSYGGRLVSFGEIPRDYILGDAWSDAGASQVRRNEARHDKTQSHSPVMRTGEIR